MPQCALMCNDTSSKYFSTFLLLGKVTCTVSAVFGTIFTRWLNKAVSSQIKLIRRVEAASVSRAAWTIIGYLHAVNVYHYNDLDLP